MVINMEINYHLLIAMILTLLTGCTVGPKYQPPEVQVTDTWKAAGPTPEIPMVKNWWEVFDDAQLTALIDRALQSNPSLMAAFERVDRAREFSKVMRSRLIPQLNFDPAASNVAMRAHQFGSTAHPPPTLIQNHIDKFTLPLTLLYEVDFWGKWRGQFNAAKARADAEMQAYNMAFLLLTTDLANAYFQMRIQDAQIEIYRSILATRKLAVNIQQSRYDTHLINYSDVAFSQSDYDTVESEYYESLRKRALFENQIAVLLGVSPSEFKMESAPLKALPPVIPATVPAKVLLRRPDLAEQERIMAALHAEINVAYTSYFPSVDFAGGISFLSNNFIRTVKNMWFVGSNIVEILFDGGERSANIGVKKAAFREAFSIYQQKVLSAFQEVEDALVSLDWVSGEMRAIQSAIQSIEIAHQIAVDRYHFGLASYLNAANNERVKLDKELDYLHLLSQRYLYSLHLIKAIGGGWN
jgi:outer membrane protein, multidrug efflux system